MALRRCSFRGRVVSFAMPPNEDNNNDLDGIRVVDDSDQEEVVRLESPEMPPLARKDPSKEALALPTMMGDADEDEVPIVISPENEWLVAAEAKEVTSVPTGWFVLLFLVLGGVFLWAFSQSAEIDETVDVSSLPNSVIDEESIKMVEKSLSKDKEAALIEEAARDYEGMENLLRGFFGAETPEERLPFVRHAERVKPLMEDYYRRNDFETYKYEKVQEYHVINLETWPFVALSAMVEGGEEHAILLENTDDGYRVDWESFVGYQPMTLKELIEKRPTEGVDLRVYGTYDNFYSYEFTEELDYVCVKLTTRNSDQVVFGYIQAETEIASEFKKHLFAPKGKRKTQPFILKVRFLPDSKAPRSVLIEEIVSALWAYPKNPDDE